MSDVVLHAIKNFLYERQQPDEGLLDGTFYLFKGFVNIDDKIKFYKSLFPTYLIIERHRRKYEELVNDNIICRFEIFYVVYVSKINFGFISKTRTNCERHYFKSPEGAIFQIMNIIQKSNQNLFTAMIVGNSIGPVIVHIDRTIERIGIQNLINNILVYFHNVHFEIHQLYNEIV